MDRFWSDIKVKAPKTPETFIDVLRSHLPNINSGRALEWGSQRSLRLCEKKICLFIFFYLLFERYTEHVDSRCGLKERFLNDLQLQIQTRWTEVQGIMARQGVKDAFVGLIW